MCRTPWYDERTIDDARRHARERAAVVIQAAWRMHACRARYLAWRRTHRPDHPLLRRKWIAQRLADATDRLTLAAGSEGLPPRGSPGRPPPHPSMPVRATSTRGGAAAGARGALRGRSERGVPWAPACVAEGRGQAEEGGSGGEGDTGWMAEAERLMAEADATAEMARRVSDRAVAATVLRRANRGMPFDEELGAVLRAQYAGHVGDEWVTASGQSEGPGRDARGARGGARDGEGSSRSREVGASPVVTATLVDRRGGTPRSTARVGGLVLNADPPGAVDWDRVLEVSVARGTLDGDCAICLNVLRRESVGPWGSRWGTLAWRASATSDALHGPCAWQIQHETAATMSCFPPAASRGSRAAMRSTPSALGPLRRLRRRAAVAARARRADRATRSVSWPTSEAEEGLGQYSVGKCSTAALARAAAL